jgi:hypothetical protein
VLPPVAAFVGAGLTAVATTVTIVSGLDTLNAKHQYDVTPSSGLLGDGRAKETRTNALFWTTLALGALTGVAAIWFVDWRSGTTTVRASAGSIEGVF